MMEAVEPNTRVPWVIAKSRATTVINSIDMMMLSLLDSRNQKEIDLQKVMKKLSKLEIAYAPYPFVEADYYKAMNRTGVYHESTIHSEILTAKMMGQKNKFTNNALGIRHIVNTSHDVYFFVNNKGIGHLTHANVVNVLTNYKRFLTSDVFLH